MALLVAAVVILYVLVLALAVLVIVLYRQFGLVYLGSRRSYELAGPAVGEAAPNGLRVVNPAISRGEQEILDWREVPSNGGTLLLLGGEACPACAGLLQQLNEGFGAARAFPLRVLFIDLDPRGMPTIELPAPVNGCWQHRRSIDGSVHRAFDVQVSPFAFVVDGGGVIRGKGIVSSLPEVMALLEKAGLSPHASAVPPASAHAPTGNHQDFP
jgi:hypothetical protein